MMLYVLLLHVPVTPWLWPEKVVLIEYVSSTSFLFAFFFLFWCTWTCHLWFRSGRKLCQCRAHSWIRNWNKTGVAGALSVGANNYFVAFIFWWINMNESIKWTIRANGHYQLFIAMKCPDTEHLVRLYGNVKTELENIGVSPSRRSMSGTPYRNLAWRLIKMTCTLFPKDYQFCLYQQE